MLTILSRKWKLERYVIPSDYQPCSCRLMLNCDFLHVRWKASHTHLGVRELEAHKRCPSKPERDYGVPGNEDGQVKVGSRRTDRPSCRCHRLRRASGWSNTA